LFEVANPFDSTAKIEDLLTRPPPNELLQRVLHSRPLGVCAGKLLRGGEQLVINIDVRPHDATVHTEGTKMCNRLAPLRQFHDVALKDPVDE